MTSKSFADADQTGDALRVNSEHLATSYSTIGDSTGEAMEPLANVATGSAWSASPGNRVPWRTVSQPTREHASNTARFDPTSRFNLHKHLKAARVEAERALQALERGELVDVDHAWLGLREALQRAWALRSVRDETWGDALNELQVGIRPLLPVDVSVEMLQAIRRVIELLESGSIDDEDCDEAVRLLRQHHIGAFSWIGREFTPDGDSDSHECP